MKLRDQITLGLGGLALLVSVLFVGGVLRWTQALVGALVAGALAVQLLAKRRLDRFSPLVAMLLAAMALCAIQLVPLPEAVRDVLTPFGNAIRNDGATLAGTHPWPSLSLDPAATLRALCFYTILLGVAVLALRFSASERSRFVMLGAVAGTCGLAALVTGAHTLLSAESLFGVYSPVNASPPVLGPLLNMNHLGSLMALGTVLSLGLVFHDRQPAQLRVVWIFTALGCALVAFATASRGAALSLGIGASVTVALLVASRLGASEGGRRRTRTRIINDLPIAIVVVFGLGLAIYSTAGKVASQLDDTSLTELDHPASKFAAWRASMQLVKEAPTLGIGRGALEPVFTRVHEASAYVTFSHLENEYVQALVEWGIFGALVLAALAAWCAANAGRKWRDGPLAAAAIGALTGVLFHSTVDFGLELLGLAVPVTIVAASLLVVPLREAGVPGRVRLVRGALVGGLVIAALVLLTGATRTTGEDRDMLVDGNPTLDQARDVIERHPLYYFGFAEAATSLMSSNDGRAVKFLNHALVLHPTHPGLHRLAARMLAAGKRWPQASVEMSLALHGTPLPHKILAEIVAVMPSADLAAESIPVDYAKPDLVIASLRQLNRMDVAMRWLVLVVAQPQTTTTTADKLYELATERGDTEAAEAAAVARLKVARTTTSRLMLARVLFVKKDYDGVMKNLSDVKEWSGRIDEQAEGWLLVCDVRIAHHEWDAALECVHRLDGAGLLGAGSRSDITRRIKKIEEERGYEARKQAAEALQQTIQHK